MAEVNSFTQNLMSMLPQWMKMAKDPASVGAQFLNVFGVEFQEVRDYLDNVISNQYLETADIQQIDITYKVPLALPTILDVETVDTVVGYKGDDVYNFSVVDTIREFYNAPSTIDVAILDRGAGVIYLRPRTSLIDGSVLTPLDYVSINGAAHYDLILHHIWNAFDEFGLLLGLQRLYGERNQSFKNRIMDIFVNPIGSTREGLINSISRELGLEKTDVRIHELGDIAFKNSLLNDDGTPSTKLVSYVEKINKILGFTWDNMSWGEAYWRSLEEANVGFDYLPHIWDATTVGWSESDFQSGIGDEDDLLVRAPEKLDNTRNFKYYVSLRGKINDSELVYPQHDFKYKIIAKGTILNQENRPESYKYTVIASEIINVGYVIKAWQKYNYNTDIDFTNLTGFTYDSEVSPNLEVVDGTVIMSPKAHDFLELEVYMQTADKTKTPTLNSLTVKWKDSADVAHDLVFDTQANFDSNTASINVTKQNVVTQAPGSVQLGFGDFYNVINTVEDWEKTEDGEVVNVLITDEGSIRLVLPKA